MNLTENGYAAERELSDGRTIGLMPLTYGRFRIVAGPTEGWKYGYSDGY